MKKKTGFLSLLLLILLLLCIPLIAQAATDVCSESADGQHSWVQFGAPATCTENGWSEWQCEKCYLSRDYTVIPALGHDMKEDGKVPTCTEGGYACLKCTRCGQTDRYVEYQPLGHDWDNGTITTAATCASAGVKTYTCSRCGGTYTEAIPPTGQHTPVSIPAVAATCTAAGKTEGSQCSVCGAILTAQQDIPALGHSPSAVAGKAATCTEAGLTEGSTCSRCGATLTAQQDIPALGHAWDSGTVTANPTCTANGEIVYFCTRCGETWSETLPATGHTPVATSAVEATCTTGGRTSGTQCSVCGAVLAGPQDTPPLGHAWNEGTITQYPGCTYEGVKTYTCTRCGATTTETIAAYGHWWDEGVVTKEAGYLEEGEITYSCQRDASHKKTEAIPVKETPGGQSVMSLVRSGGGGITTMKNPVPLMIETQPVGGALSGEGTYELSIGVMGGDKPYTYEWHRVSVSLTQQATAIIESLGGLAAAVQKQCELASAKVVQMSERNTGWILTEPAGKTTTPLDSNTIVDYAFSMIVGDNNPTYTATGSGTYYCVVRDDNNDEVTSVKVEVGEKLHIIQQPENANLYGEDSVQLTCVAAGGSGPEHYLYNWFDAGGNLLSDESTLTVSQEGEYYCQVWDFGADDMVESEPATVYSNDNPPWVEVAQDDYYIIPGEETALIEMHFGGGIAPLTFKLMDLYGETLIMFTVDSTEDQPVIYEADELGTYFMYVTDAMGETKADMANVEYKQLEIALQPKGGILSEDGRTPVNVGITMAEGETPLTYTFYCNGESVFGGQGEYAASYLAYQPGNWYIHVEDATGRWADSDIVTVYEYNTASINATPVIVRQPESKILPYTEGTQYYSASLVCKAVCPNHDPLEYVWQVKIPGENGGWLSGTPTSDTLTLNAIDEHGTYPWRCIVTNTKTGDQVISNEASISVQLVCQNDSTYSGTYAHFSIHGGQPPYVVKEYQRRISIDNELKDGVISYVNILYKTRTINNDKWMEDLLEDFQVGDWDWRDNDFYYEYPAYYKGGYIIQSRMADIYIEVLSADGQTVTSSIVENVR